MYEFNTKRTSLINLCIPCEYTPQKLPAWHRHFVVKIYITITRCSLGLRITKRNRCENCSSVYTFAVSRKHVIIILACRHSTTTTFIHGLVNVTYS